MKKNKYVTTFAVVLTAVFAVLFLGLYFSDSSTEKQPAFHLLFVQKSSAAVLNPINVTKGIYKITLKVAEPSVVYFSDQPKRIAGRMTITRFLSIWDAAVKHNKKFEPNIAVEAMQVNSSKEFNFVFAASKPNYDKVNNSFSYRLRLLSSNQKITTQLKLKDLTIFVDTVPGSRGFIG